MNKRYLLLILCISILCNVCIYAQSSETIDFTLYKNRGHYFLESDINGAAVDFMLESGIPALLINEKFYNENQSRFNLNVVASNSKINLGGRVFKIKYTAEGKINIGKAIYEGRVFVLEGELIAKLPIQHLKNPTDNSSIVTLDLPNNTRLDS